jgi:Cytochrome P460
MIAKLASCNFFKYYLFSSGADRAFFRAASLVTFQLSAWRKAMTRIASSLIVILTVTFAVLGGRVMSAQDKYTLSVPGGLAFSEFRGYEAWQVVSISHDGPVMAAILANPVMIKAYEAGLPGNGKPFPDGAKMAKVHWNPTKMETFPSAIVPGTQHDVDFMVKDSKRFADSGGWGWGAFEYDPASDTFRPGNTKDSPPQEHDAKCGFACHTIVKTRDYVFTDYAHR